MTELEIIGDLYIKCETLTKLVEEMRQTINRQDKTISRQRNIIVQYEHSINHSPVIVKDLSETDGTIGY